MSNPWRLVSVLVLLAALGGALVLARQEPIPKDLSPPPRSELARAPQSTTELAEPGEVAEVDTPDEPAPRKGYSLTRMDLENAMLKVRSHAVSCRNGTGSAPPIVAVKLIIAPSGQVTNVVLPPELHNDVGACVSRVFRSATFPAWSQPPVPQVEWTYALRFDGGD